MKKTKLVIIALVMIIFSSCRVADYSIVSTQNVPISTEEGIAVKGWGWTIKDAIDDALKEEPGSNAIINCVISQAFVGYKAKGIAVKIEK